MHTTLITAKLITASLIVALGGFLATGAAHADPFDGQGQHSVDVTLKSHGRP